MRVHRTESAGDTHELLTCLMVAFRTSLRSLRICEFASSSSLRRVVASQKTPNTGQNRIVRQRSQLRPTVCNI